LAQRLPGASITEELYEAYKKQIRNYYAGGTPELPLASIRRWASAITQRYTLAATNE
jgi:hypothetical protein